jgi:hypothetical protein
MTNFSFSRLGHVGRLGNQLWQIAWVYAQSYTDGNNGYIPSNWDYRHIFSVPEDFYRPMPRSCVDGGNFYYQELDYWKGLDKEIWKIFQPTEEALSRSIEYVGNHYDDMLNGCSVHHRLGDYLNHPNHFPIPTTKYYVDSMKSVLVENPDTKFYIFSDQVEKIKSDYSNHEFTRSLLDEGRIIFFDGTPRPVEVRDRVGEPQDWLDLFAMSFCKNHIIANSTFSWWGAFLSQDNSPRYPSVWFGSNPEVATIPWERMIPDSWTLINVN